MKILILGASGMLGSRLLPYLRDRGHEPVAASRNSANGIEIDLYHRASTFEVMHAINPDVVINLVGLTDIERCESYPKEAWQANVQSAQNIAFASHGIGAHLIHLSTDQVYDNPTPCLEDMVCPGNCYAITKHAGELAAMQAGACILRTNFFGVTLHAHRRSLTDWLLSALEEQRPIQVFDDVYFSPLNMTTLCSLIYQTVNSQHAGIFNLGSHGAMSKADFAFAFADALGMPSGHFNRVSAQQSDRLKTWRPKNMSMDSSLFERSFQVRLPSLKTEIDCAAKEYRAQL